MTKTDKAPTALNIIELGGYPDFSKMLQAIGYQSVVIDSMRKALKYIKNSSPQLIIAEFNFQSDFRDRTSQLESLMASIAQKPDTRVIVFYDTEQADKFERVLKNHRFHACLTYPIDEVLLKQAAESALA